MAQLDAVDLSNSLRQRLVDFAADDNFVREPKLGEIAREIWSGPPERGGLISDLWVEGAFPSKASTMSLDDLVAAKSFDARLRDALDSASAVPGSRKLYSHQLQAIETAQSGSQGRKPSLVVTAGTGTGKTESFLLPVLNDLYRNPPQDSQGAKCIILYPMNALVNDQVDRLYSWLNNQEQVSLFHFTSETPEDRRMADAQGVPIWKPCRMRTRQEARGLESHSGDRIVEDERGSSPDILITNYSMLEYMLCRPQDSVFFGSSLRAVVLDEAHLYTGTLAAEITLLLRRLLLRCDLRSEEVLQVATSATLGTGDTQELEEFAATIFSKPPELVHVIVGESTRPPMSEPMPPEVETTAEAIVDQKWLAGPTIIEDGSAGPRLAVDEPLCQQLRSSLPAIVSGDFLQTLGADEIRPAVLLNNSLSASPIVHRMEGALWNRRHMPLSELGEVLFGEQTGQSQIATVQLLQLAATARTEPASYPLVPHRIHLMARPVDGLTVCLNTDCTGLKTALPPLGAVAAGYHDTCEFCDSRVLSLERCRNCGEWVLASQDTDIGIAPALPKVRVEEDNTPQPGRRRLALKHSSADDAAMFIDPATGELRGAGAEGTVRLFEVYECSNCHETDFSAFYSGTPLTLSVMAETLLSELPEFSASGGGNGWLPAGGRRLLAFSDSRREAARLGPLLTNQHEQQLIRAAIVKALESTPLADEGALRRARRRLSVINEELEDSDLSPGERHLAERDRARYESELAQLQAGGPVNWWAEILSGQSALGEVLDRPTAGQQLAHDWSQQKWEDNRDRVTSRARELLGRELASPIRRSVATLESLGLVEVTYPGLEQLEPPGQFLGALPRESVRQALTQCWTDFLASLCDTLRSDGAISLGDELDDTYNFGRTLIGRWSSADDERGTRLIRFVGATVNQSKRRYAKAVLKSCGMSDTEANDASEPLLRVCFQQLLEAARNQSLSWVEADQRQARGNKAVDAIRLDFFELGLRRPATLFQCQTTGHVWPRTVVGCTPEVRTEGSLHPVLPGDLDNDPRIGRRRREYFSSPIFQMGLWAEEHSAQLDPRENRRLQDLFKAGIRNILSSTTTLELGIDIGGLNGVLMSNVPPGKANYLQRAGRAGRRSDGTSVVATFSRPRPFDREVFQRIGDFLDIPLRRPIVFLDRAKVVRRHLHAFLLGEFFRSIDRPSVGAMDAYGRMGGFTGRSRATRWEGGHTRPLEIMPSSEPPLSDQFAEYLVSLKEDSGSDLEGRIEDLLSSTSIALESNEWEELLGFALKSFEDSVHSWVQEYDELLNQWKEARNPRQSNALFYQLRLRYETTVIEALADRQFLPRYGFPIDVMKLRVTTPDENRPNRVREEDQFRLERNSILALREYVPGSQLLVGGRLVRSRGILRHWTGENIDSTMGLRGRYTRCGNNHLYYWASGESERNCPFCLEPAAQTPSEFIIPKHGFSSAGWDPPKWSTAPELVGSVETVSATFTPAAGGSGEPSIDAFSEVSGLRALYREDGELLVYNTGDKQRGFAVCLRCGYSESETELGEGKMKLPGGFEFHAPLNSVDERWQCWSGNAGPPVLRNQTLAAREVTDVLLLDFSSCLGGGQSNLSLVTTLGYGLHRAAARILQLDGRELGVVTIPAGESGRGLGTLLYDNVPGGAGHVRELLLRGRNWLELARNVLFVSPTHDQRCKSACLDCLLSFETQVAMQQGLLNRPEALSVLSGLLDGSEIGAGTASIEVTDTHDPTVGDNTFSQLSDQERINRGGSRMNKRRR